MQKDYIGTEKCGSDTPKNTGETLYLGSTSSESFKRERWVKLRCLYNSRGRCLQIPLHRITDSASNGSVFPVVTEHFSASSDHAFL